MCRNMKYKITAFIMLIIENYNIEMEHLFKIENSNIIENSNMSLLINLMHNCRIKLLIISKIVQIPNISTVLYKYLALHHYQERNKDVSN